MGVWSWRLERTGRLEVVAFSASPLVAEAGTVKLDGDRALSIQNLSENYLMRFAGSVGLGRSGCAAHTARG